MWLLFNLEQEKIIISYIYAGSVAQLLACLSDRALLQDKDYCSAQ
jgi:hypothetical protein